MFFDIDADLIYTRPHMTEVDGKVVIIEQNILVRPTHNWKRIHISSPLIAVLQDSLNNLIQLFDIDYFGQMFAASAFETYREIDDSDEPFLQLIIQPEFNKVGSEEHARSLWNSFDAVDNWRDAFESFEDYFEQYSERRYGITIEQWFENEQGEKVTHNTEALQELGGYHEGTWYSEGFRFAGCTNIKDIKTFNPETGRRNKASLEKVIKKAVSELQDAAYEADESIEDFYKSIDVDSYMDWHDGRIRFFQNKLGHNRSAAYQKLLLKASGLGHAFRNPRIIWDWISPFLVGALIGIITITGYKFISQLFD